TNQTFPNIVAGNGWILVLGQAIRSGVLIDCFRQGRAKAGQMRSAVWIRNGVGETKNLIVVAVVILENAIDKSLVALSRNVDRFRMNDLLVLAQLPDEFLNAVLVKKCLFFGRIDPLIGQSDFEPGI